MFIFLVGLITSGLICAVVFIIINVAYASGDDEHSKRPNIIFILADDLVCIKLC